MGAAALEPVAPSTCKGRRYDRLNEDYRPTHAICRFFLDHMGPSGDHGSRESLPFLVNMGRLFEMFVAEWLKEHLPERFGLSWQQSFRIGSGESLRFQIDMMIYERSSGRNLLVLDAKYKAPTSPSTDDILQIIGYAHSLGCPGAALVYPTAIPEPLDVRIRDIGIRTMRFDISKSVAAGGEEFLRELVAWAAKELQPANLS